MARPSIENKSNVPRDPHRYLLTRIIAEDDTHVTITLRIEKSTLRQFLPFLSALIDVAIDPPQKGESRN